MSGATILARATAIIGIYFLIHAAIINDFGLSWDFHVHHYAGLRLLGRPIPSMHDPPPVPFTPPDPRLTLDDPFGPFIKIIPTASYVLLYEKLQSLPFDTAYNVPMVVFGALGVGVLYIFIAQAVGETAALWSAVFLATLPNYFGYLHNNMKDIPNAFAFTLTVFLFWRLEKYRRWRDLLAAVVSFAFAFNVKINSAVIPLVCFTWWSITRKNGLKRIGYMPLLFFLLGPLSALALWWPFWDDPLGKLMEIPYFFSHNTVNMPVLLFGKMYRSGVNVPWYYPFAYLGITTPLVTIVAWGIGGMVIVRKILRNVSGETEKMYLLLLVWFGIPLLRYLSPKMGAIDGVRHFMEVVYPFAAIAGVGAAYIEKKSKIYLQRSTPHAGKFRRMLPSAWRLLVVLMLVYPLIYFHPYQTSYFNELIGGIRGAQGKFDIDFWATPQREAVRWINAHAPQNAIVHIVMGQSTAATYLRPDLLKNVNAKNIWESEYVVILNRESFFALYPDVPSFLKKKKEEGNVVMTREIDGVPLVWVTKK